jgi:hypothetical protein
MRDLKHKVLRKVGEPRSKHLAAARELSSYSGGAGQGLSGLQVAARQYFQLPKVRGRKPGEYLLPGCRSPNHHLNLFNRMASSL